MESTWSNPTRVRMMLVGSLDWANVRRTWDGVKLFWRDEKWSVDGWYVRPVEIRNRDVDEYDEKRRFFGLYSTYKGIKNHGIDAYFLGLVDEGDVANSNLRTDQGDAVVPYTGDLGVYTLGSRFWGKTPAGGHWWDYDTEFAGQWGRFASDVIQAWMRAAETGYTFSDWPWTPRVGMGIDYASGDQDPHDGVHQTFNQLFPLGHAYFGYLDQIGRQNLWAQNVNLSFKPHKSVTGYIAWHTFWTDKNRDALYNAGGTRVRRSPAGGVGDEIGHELDLTVNWQIDPHASVLFGYSHMWTSDFISQSGSDENPDLFYLQYSYKF